MALDRKIILASASKSRKRLLESVGISPEVMVSGVDEESAEITALAPKDMVIALAIMKAHSIKSAAGDNSLIIAADSTFEFNGKSLGKPLTREVAIARAKEIRGHFGYLHTGQCVIDTAQGIEVSDISTSKVYFSAMTDSEIESYVDSGEPLEVAGGFTLDGLSAPYISKIDGDPSGIIGLSLPLLRKSFISLGLKWEDAG
jgi:septum formation protein